MCSRSTELTDESQEVHECVLHVDLSGDDPRLGDLHRERDEVVLGLVKAPGKFRGHAVYA